MEAYIKSDGSLVVTVCRALCKGCMLRCKDQGDDEKDEFFHGGKDFDLSHGERSFSSINFLLNIA